MAGLRQRERKWLAERKAFLGRECRGRHLLTDAHPQQREIQPLNDRSARSADHPDQEQRESRKWIARVRENPHVAPGIDVLFDRQQRDIRCFAASAELGAVRVLFPAHVAQQRAICGTKGNEITAAAMIGAEDEFSRGQLRKGALDVCRAQTGAITPDRDNFVVAEIVNFLDRISQTRREVMTGLSMDSLRGSCGTAGRSEKVDVGFRRKFGEGGKIQERPRGTREGAPREVAVGFLGEDENGTAGHSS